MATYERAPQAAAGSSTQLPAISATEAHLQMIRRKIAELEQARKVGKAPRSARELRRLSAMRRSTAKTFKKRLSKIRRITVKLTTQWDPWCTSKKTSIEDCLRHGRCSSPFLALFKNG